MIQQYFDKNLNKAAIESALKPDEEIVCENATVIADKNGNISWIDNKVPICVITKEKENGR